MNEFKKIVPKKQNKKRAFSAKRSNSLTEENKNKKSINTERYYTAYEIFEKINSKTKKKPKLRANSSSKKKKKSKIKNFLSLEHNKKRNNLESIFTNNTHYTTFETDNIKKMKISPKKEEFSKILEKANELLSIQSDILIQCGKLNKNLAKSELEIETKLKNQINNNGTNVLPGLAKALYLLELKKENNTARQSNYNEINNNNKKKIDFKEKEERMDNSFYIKKFNELNGFIGELGYSYVYNEFINENYKKENLIIYFDNIKKLINMLHQTISNQSEILIKQENQIQKYEDIINDYKKNLNSFQINNFNDTNKNFNINTNLISSIKNINPNSTEEYKTNESNLNKSNSKNHILINENLNYNNMDDMEENNETKKNSNIYINNNTNYYDNINSQEFDNLEECNNIFKNNLINESKLPNEKARNTQYYNSYISQSSFPIQNNEKDYINNSQLKNSCFNRTINNNFNENLDNRTNEQGLPPELSNNYLNYYNDKNILSSMINSGSFFESYKRNKELKHNLNFNYNEKSIDNE